MALMAVVDHDRSLTKLRRTSLFSALPLLMLRAVGDLRLENVAMYPGTLAAFNPLHLLVDGQVNNNGMSMDLEVHALHLIHTLLFRTRRGTLLILDT